MLLKIHEEFDYEVAQLWNVRVRVAEMVVDVLVVYEDGGVAGGNTLSQWTSFIICSAIITWSIP